MPMYGSRFIARMNSRNRKHKKVEESNLCAFKGGADAFVCLGTLRAISGVRIVLPAGPHDSQIRGRYSVVRASLRLAVYEGSASAV